MARGSIGRTETNRWKLALTTGAQLAVKQKLVDNSPFADIPSGSLTSATRLRFVSREVIEKVIFGNRPTAYREFARYLPL